MNERSTCPAGRLTQVMAILIALSSWQAAVATAQDNAAEPQDEAAAAEPPAGHSLHGEAFNEGPRQRAYRMPGCGELQFDITTSDPRAQEFFTQGVGQLHGFWYFEAERSFRQAAALDPDCAMANWGMAVANRDNAERAKELIAKAAELKEGVTPREATWIDAFNRFLAPEKETKQAARWRALIRDLESIVHEYPDDVEARAFLGWAIWEASRKGVPINSHEAADALLKQVLAANPAHAGAMHYIIHLWDNEKAARALPSAATIGPAAPAIAHMWHMAGHIYAKLDRHADAAWQQEASSRVDHAYMQRDRVMPYLIHNYAHNQEWCARSLSHVGRAHDALAIAGNLVELPRHPKHNALDKRGSCAAYGRQRLLETLVRYELWDELLEMADTSILEPTEITAEQAKRLHAIGLAHFGMSDAPRAASAIESLDALAAEVEAKRQQAGDEAAEAAANEDKPQDEIDKARADAQKRFDSDQKLIAGQLAELRAWQALAEGRTEEIACQLDALKDVPKPRLARLYMLAGEHDKAAETARSAVDGAKRQVQPLAALVEVLDAAGKTDEAAEAFDRLRELAADVELDLPIFRRLEPVARSLGLPDDWRPAAVRADDIGERPELATLGPLVWTPTPAANWTLEDGQGNTISLADYRGRPVVVIFYLGVGCLHCVEQLEAFAPLADQYAAAGISLVGISTDDLATLKQSEDRFNLGENSSGFPFPLVSDAVLETFRAYRCHDDFEQMPLHGTFLIDGEGLIRWQDISYEPFTEPAFLLDEARRLLGQGAGRTSAAK